MSYGFVALVCSDIAETSGVNPRSFESCLRFKTKAKLFFSDVILPLLLGGSYNQ